MGKGSNTTTTQQQQTYNPAGGPQIQSALTQAQNAAQLPFNIPQAPVAGFSQDQQSAFGNINNAQGMAQPYINQAQQYFSPQGAQQFFNPYADAVTAQMQNIFGQQNQQNTSNLVQSAGGVGADRIAVGQGNLANQQGLAAGQTYANLYGQAAQQAQSAGYGTAALGSQAQNAALQGSQAQLASGGLQQQLQQAQLNSPYQQQLAQSAFPYQQAQFLAGITGSLAPGLGGTTTGQGTTTGPSPSLLSQILGLGTAGVGAAGGMGAFSGSGKGSGGVGSYGQGSNATGYGAGTGGISFPMFARGGGIGFDEGGATSSPFDLPPNFNDKPINVAEHSIIPTVQTPAIRPEVPKLNLNPPAQQQQSGGGLGQMLSAGLKLGAMFAARGGTVNPYAGGEGFAAGGTPSPLDDAQWPYGPEGGPSPLDNAYWPSGPVGGPSDVVNPNDPVPMPTRAAYNDWQRGADASMADGTGATSVGFKPAFPPPSGSHGRSVGAPTPAAASEAAEELSAPSPAAVTPSQSTPAGKSDRFVDSPWAALMAAGLGIAGGTSPFAAVNIGQGGLQGLKTLQEQRSSGQKDETIAQATRRLDLEAKHHEDQFTRMTPYQKAEIGLHETAATREEMKPVKVGVDLLGRDVMARRDPKTGQYINTMTGKPVDADTNTLQVPPQYKAPAPGGAEAEADPAALPPHARLTQGFNAPEGVRPEILAQLPPQRAATIRAIDEGRQSLTSVPLRDRQSVMDQLNAYDGNWDQSIWTLRNAQQRDLSSNGNAGKMLLATNQLLPHLNSLGDRAAKLDNGNYPGGNVITNWIATQRGDPRVKDFQTIRAAAANDAARLLRGTGQMAEKDIEEWRNNFNESGSPAQLQTVIASLADDLIGARVSSIRHAYRMNMRMEPPEMVSKEAQAASAAIKERAEKANAAYSGKPAAVSAPAAAAPAAAAPPTAKPPTVTQNGYPYVLQPDGSYK